ncbi:MAG: hypothetical protein AAGE01_16850, partial [Pseudomonadota bacterium]
DIRLFVVEIREGVSNGDVGGDGATAGDGKATSEGEILRMVRSGRFAVDTLPTRRGLTVSVLSNDGTSIFFTAQGEAGPVEVREVGMSIDSYPSVLLVQRETVDRTARTLAHEIGHILGLFGPDDDEVAGIRPEERVPQNLMSEMDAEATAFVDDTVAGGLDRLVISQRQRSVMKSSPVLTGFGFPGTRNSPARRLPYGIGGTGDPQGDLLAGAPLALDLLGAALSTLADDEHDHFSFEIGGQTAAHAALGLTFSMLIDRDGDEATGSAVGGMTGVDAVVDIDVFGENGEMMALALLTRFPSEASELLIPEPIIEPQDRQQLGLNPGDRIRLRLRKDAVGMTADAVPVTLLARDSEGTIVDSLSFIYERDRWQIDPTLRLDQELAVPGQAVPFSISGLGAGETFELYVDDEVVLSEVLDGTGEFDGAFVAPGATGVNRRFVVAIDETGRLAESLIIIPDAVFDDGFETR